MPMKAVRLRTERMTNPIAIDVAAPLFTWICEGGKFQSAYEISVCENGTEIWNSGKVSSGDMFANYGGKARSRMNASWKVRLWDENDSEGEWSEEATFELGFLEKECWSAKWINPEPETDPAKRYPASYLRKSFNVGKIGKARLYITCHGLYHAFINGKKVGDQELTPGHDSYKMRLQYQTYDVADLLKEGENEITVVLGDGWYRGCKGIDGSRNTYGETLALLCQLEIDENAVLVSDESWQASQNGMVRENDMQLRETQDARMENITDWHGVIIENHGYENLVCPNTVPVRRQESFVGKIITTPNGETVVDFGQNMAGHIELEITAEEGQSVLVALGETLDKDGNFTNANFQPEGGRNKEGGIAQEMMFICKKGKNVFRPYFTYSGFQYAKVETDATLEDAVFTSHAVYSDMERVGFFSCSNEDVNKLVENTLWSQRSNFCDVPTDCPTRERAGYTGDAQIFMHTGLFLCDCYPLLRKWLKNCALEQRDDGCIHCISPINKEGGGPGDMFDGSCGWGDGGVIIPYEMYKTYNDIRILEETYPMMLRWIDYLMNRAKKNHPKRLFRRNPYRRYTIDMGFDWGEWLEPDVDNVKRLTQGLMNGRPEVCTAFLCYSSRLVSEVAKALGKDDDAKKYADISEKARKGFWYSSTKKGIINSDRQCEYVRPIAFKLLDEKETEQAAASLNELVKAKDYHLNTGFLSTAHLNKALSDMGYVETAYRLLLQDTCPSWLYAIKMGANTIWETWDAKKTDGTVGKASLNHYSYGSVVGWLFDSVCGIKLDRTELEIKPCPNRLLEHAEASWLSPIGKIESSWRYEGDEIIFDFTIPANTTAKLTLPNGETCELEPGKHRRRIAAV